jgi:nucleoside-diphosphate-sugar epimerase
MGRNSDNTLIKKSIGWSPDENLEAGLIKTYKWISNQIELNKDDI